LNLESRDVRGYLPFAKTNSGLSVRAHDVSLSPRSRSASRNWCFAAMGACAGAVLALVGCGSGSRPVSSARPLDGDASPAGTLYLADTRSGKGLVTIVDVAGARAQTRALSELYPGDPPFTIAIVGGRLVVFGHLRTYAYRLDLREPPRSLGESWFFIPSAATGRVWLVRLDAHDPHHAHGLGSVREITVTGRVTVAGSSRPPHWPIAAVDDGLLVQGDTLEVWQPDTGRTIRKLPGVFPVATRHLLSVSCAGDCPVLHVTNTRTGADLQIAPGSGFRFVESYDGAFSPDGKLVAVPATTGQGQSRVAIIKIARHTATLVRGVPLASDYPLIAWASTGWLFYNAGRGRLAEYRPGALRATLLHIHVQPFEAIAAR
jgi:hypothetical protein